MHTYTFTSTHTHTHALSLFFSLVYSLSLSLSFSLSLSVSLTGHGIYWRNSKIQYMYCNTQLQRTATHSKTRTCNTLQHTATRTQLDGRGHVTYWQGTDNKSDSIKSYDGLFCHDRRHGIGIGRREFKKYQIRTSEYTSTKSIEYCNTLIWYDKYCNPLIWCYWEKYCICSGDILNIRNVWTWINIHSKQNRTRIWTKLGFIISKTDKL